MSELTFQQYQGLLAQRVALDGQLKAEERRRNLQASTIGWALLSHFETHSDGFTKNCLDFLHRVLTDEKKRRDADIAGLMKRAMQAEKPQEQTDPPKASGASSMFSRKG